MRPKASSNEYVKRLLRKYKTRCIKAVVRHAEQRGQESVVVVLDHDELLQTQQLLDIPSAHLLLPQWDETAVQLMKRKRQLFDVKDQTRINIVSGSLQQYMLRSNVPASAANLMTDVTRNRHVNGVDADFYGTFKLHVIPFIWALRATDVLPTPAQSSGGTLVFVTFAFTSSLYRSSHPDKDEFGCTTASEAYAYFSWRIRQLVAESQVGLMPLDVDSLPSDAETQTFKDAGALVHRTGDAPDLAAVSWRGAGCQMIQFVMMCKLLTIGYVGGKPPELPRFVPHAAARGPGDEDALEQEADQIVPSADIAAASQLEQISEAKSVLLEADRRLFAEDKALFRKYLYHLALRRIWNSDAPGQLERYRHVLSRAFTAKGLYSEDVFSLLPEQRHGRSQGHAPPFRSGVDPDLVEDWKEMCRYIYLPRWTSAQRVMLAAYLDKLTYGADMVHRLVEVVVAMRTGKSLAAVTRAMLPWDFEKAMRDDMGTPDDNKTWIKATFEDGTVDLVPQRSIFMTCHAAGVDSFAVYLDAVKHARQVDEFKQMFPMLTNEPWRKRRCPFNNLCDDMDKEEPLRQEIMECNKLRTWWDVLHKLIPRVDATSEFKTLQQRREAMLQHPVSMSSFQSVYKLFLSAKDQRRAQAKAKKRKNQQPQKKRGRVAVSARDAIVPMLKSSGIFRLVIWDEYDDVCQHSMSGDMDRLKNNDKKIKKTEHLELRAARSMLYDGGLTVYGYSATRNDEHRCPEPGCTDRGCLVHARFLLRSLDPHNPRKQRFTPALAAQHKLIVDRLVLLPWGTDNALSPARSGPASDAPQPKQQQRQYLEDIDHHKSWVALLRALITMRATNVYRPVFGQDYPPPGRKAIILVYVSDNKLCDKWCQEIKEMQEEEHPDHSERRAKPAVITSDQKPGSKGRINQKKEDALRGDACIFFINQARRALDFDGYAWALVDFSATGQMHDLMQQVGRVMQILPPSAVAGRPYEETINREHYVIRCVEVDVPLEHCPAQARRHAMDTTS